MLPFIEATYTFVVLAFFMMPCLMIVMVIFKSCPMQMVMRVANLLRASPIPTAVLVPNVALPTPAIAVAASHVIVILREAPVLRTTPRMINVAVPTLAPVLVAKPMVIEILVALILVASMDVVMLRSA